MNKRIVSAALWFYTGWTFWALISSVLGLNPFVGPFIGVGVAAILGGEVRRIARASRGEVIRLRD